MSDTLNSQIADIINNFLKENNLVDARTCKGEFLGMHSSLTVGGANNVVKEIEKVIADKVREARIDELHNMMVHPSVKETDAYIHQRLLELAGDDK